MDENVDEKENVFVPEQNTSRRRTILSYWKGFDRSKRPSHGPGYKLRLNRSLGPMSRLWRAMTGNEFVAVLTRGLREPRALLTGRLVAFDRYWNLILSDVIERTIQLQKSTLTGHGRPGRSRKRREQRMANRLRRFQQQRQQTDDLNEFGETVGEFAAHSSPETSDYLSFTNDPFSYSDDWLVWGGDSMVVDLQKTVEVNSETCNDSNPKEFSDPVGSCGEHIVPVLSPDLKDVRLPVSTANPCHIPPESNCHLSPVENEQGMTSNVGNTNQNNVMPKEDAPVLAVGGLTKTVERHAQLLIRGSNVVLVNFLINNPDKKSDAS